MYEGGKDVQFLQRETWKCARTRSECNEMQPAIAHEAVVSCRCDGEPIGVERRECDGVVLPSWGVQRRRRLRRFEHCRRRGRQVLLFEIESFTVSLLCVHVGEVVGGLCR